MKTLNFSPHALFQIMPDDAPPAKLESRAAHLLGYYQEGHQYYQKHISVSDPFDHEETHAFLTRLHRLTQEILEIEGELSLILRRGTQQINVLPLSHFFDEYPPADCLHMLQVVQSALVEYIHSDNCIDFKMASHTLDTWRYVFIEMQHTDIS